jgi:hypothetical protein
LRNLLALVFFIAFVNPLLFGDQIAFKNGDRLTGAILKSDAKNVLIGTVVAGDVTVLWQEIQELHSDQILYVELADGRTIVGLVTTRQGELEIATKAGAVEAPTENVVAMRNSMEQLAFEKSQRRDFLHGWEGGLDAGLELTRGNSDTRNFRFAFRSARKVGRDNLVLYAESLYSIDDLANASPHITADEKRGGARFDRDLASREFAFANTDFMSDGLQDLNLRSVLGGGVGYHLVKRTRATCGGARSGSHNGGIQRPRGAEGLADVGEWDGTEQAEGRREAR